MYTSFGTGILRLSLDPPGVHGAARQYQEHIKRSTHLQQTNQPIHCRNNLLNDYKPKNCMTILVTEHISRVDKGLGIDY